MAVSVSRTPAAPPLLDEAGIGAHLVSRGIVGEGEALAVEPLSGGFTNNVFRVTVGEREYAVKQGLLESPRTVLRAGIGRTAMEAAAMEAIRRAVGAGCPIPTLVDHDPTGHVIVMTAAPRTAALYEDELMAGRCHPAAAFRIGAFAARLHASTAHDRSLADRFGGNPGFLLRDQSIRSVRTHRPDLGDAVDAILAADRIHASALVDYDITPKNVLVHGDAVTKLDFECCRYGDPAFDVGIALAHYPVVGFARPEMRAGLLDEARAWYAGYASHLGAPAGAEFVLRTRDYLAAMLLARSNGDLILDVLQPHRAEVESLARRVLATPLDGIDALLELIFTRR
jgi:Ser/Thr protein kinase RdoA (MazF antagonist)